MEVLGPAPSVKTTFGKVTESLGWTVALSLWALASP